MEDKKIDSIQVSGRLPVLWLVGAVLLCVLVCLFSILKLRQELYEERARNFENVMDKIGVNIQNVVATRMEHVVFEAEMVADREFSGDSEITAYLKQLQTKNSSKTSYDLLALIDENGNCLASDGTTFRWDESGILHTMEQRILLTSINALGYSNEQLIYLAPLPRTVAAGERIFTHICLIMDPSAMDRYLFPADYGNRSSTFIIQQDGTYLYKWSEDSAFSNVFNVIAKLEGLDYRYKTSAEKTINDIENQVGGCAYVKVENTGYFIVYEGLNINNWTAIYIIPENDIDESSFHFMRSVILTVSIFAVIVMLNVLGFILFNHFRSMRQQTLVNERLQQAAEAERDANDAKTRFLSSMSHDIRTPMNAIIGMTSIAEKHIDDREYLLDCLKKIHLAGDHLISLVNDILDISKIESGKLTLAPISFSLVDVVENLFNIVEPQAKAKHQTFEIRRENMDSEYLFADELRLNQIFINLLTNAVKYTPDSGKITATMREEPVLDNPGMVRLIYIVEDTGIGMSEEYMKTMYGSFTRATDSRVNRIQGSGLGLAICKQLVELMDGTIECESALEKGTTFTVTLPLSVAEPPRNSQTEEEDATGHELTGMHILVAEDNDMNWEIAEELLSMYGISSERAENGQICVDRLLDSEEGEIDAVLMDIQMPVMDGRQATRMIREMDLEYLQNIPIIAMTADAFAEDIAACLEAGMNSHVAKPIDMDRLLFELKKVRHVHS